MSFQFDEGALKRAIKDDVNRHLSKVARDFERDLGLLGRHYRGRDPEAMKPALKRLWKNYGGSIREPELTRIAQEISNGGRVTAKPELW